MHDYELTVWTLIHESVASWNSSLPRAGSPAISLHLSWVDNQLASARRFANSKNGVYACFVSIFRPCMLHTNFNMHNTG